MADRWRGLLRTAEGARRVVVSSLYDRSTQPRFWPDKNDKNPATNGFIELERVKGIEPSYSAWKAAALPLSYTRAQPINYHGRQAASTADAARLPSSISAENPVPSAASGRVAP
jgi:hypothetical protein